MDDQDSPYCALLLAYAGLHRLGWDHRISQVLNQEDLLHAVGQGAIGIECRLNDLRILNMLKPLDDYVTRVRVMAEREFMKRLEGGCSVPLGVWTEYSIMNTTESLLLKGSVTSLDGTVQLMDEYVLNHERNLDVKEPYLWSIELGSVIAQRMLKLGAKKLLDEIKKN